MVTVTHFYFYFISAVLGFEAGTLQLKPHSTPVLLLAIFQTESCFSLADLGLWSSYLCLLHTWDYRCEPPNLAHSLRVLLFCPGWPWTMILPISVYWISGIIGVNHYTRPCILISVIYVTYFLYFIYIICYIYM
jgi:hypothetical protein